MADTNVFSTDTELTAVDTKVNTAITDIATNKTNIATNKTNIEAVKKSIKDLDSTYASSTKEVTLSTSTSDYGEISTEIDTLKEDLADLESEVAYTDDLTPLYTCREESGTEIKAITDVDAPLKSLTVESACTVYASSENILNLDNYEGASSKGITVEKNNNGSLKCIKINYYPTSTTQFTIGTVTLEAGKTYAFIGSKSGKSGMYGLWIYPPTESSLGTKIELYSGKKHSRRMLMELIQSKSLFGIIQQQTLFSIR